MKTTHTTTTIAPEALALTLRRARARHRDALHRAQDAWHGFDLSAFNRAERALMRAAAAVDRAEDAIEIAAGRRPVIELFCEAMDRARAARLMGATATAALVARGYTCDACGATGLATDELIGAACIDCVAPIGCGLDADGEGVRA